MRALLAGRLKEISPEEWRRVSAAVCRRLGEDPFYRSARSVFCFVGADAEIDTRPFLERTLRDGKILAVPRCGPGGSMTARIITGLSCLRPGLYGLMEPDEQAPVLPPEETDLAVLPCLGADRDGFRLGRGGGYYDRYLAGYTGHTLLVCPRQALVPRVPRDRYDLGAEKLVTD